MQAYKQWRKRYALKKKEDRALQPTTTTTTIANTAVVYLPRRENMLSEMILQLCSTEWTDSELRTVWTVLGGLTSLLPGKGAAA